MERYMETSNSIHKIIIIFHVSIHFSIHFSIHSEEQQQLEVALFGWPPAGGSRTRTGADPRELGLCHGSQLPRGGLVETAALGTDKPSWRKLWDMGKIYGISYGIHSVSHESWNVMARENAKYWI